MGKVDGLIIPRSYNDYFSRSDPQAIRDLVAEYTDDELDTVSENPVQNKVIAELIPTGATSSNKLATASDVGAAAADITAIEEKIPGAATAQNQLADKNFVNSSIGTNTANYISDNGEPFASVAALEAYSGTITNNDYAFVTGTDAAGNVYYDRYKATVSGSSVSWAKEYRLNNSSFTSDQWAAVNSGITAAKVATYDNLAASQVTGVKGNSESTYRTGNVNITKTNIGLGSVDNKTFRETAFFGLFIETDTESLTGVNYTFSPTAPTGSTNLAVGSVVRVTFKYALQSSSAIIRVIFNYGGCFGAIQAARDNQLVYVNSHEFTGGAYSSTYKHKVWDKYTTLELMWTGDSWLVMGNPVLCSYFRETQSYTVYANGLIEQWYIKITESGGNVNIPFCVQFKGAWTVSGAIQYNSNPDAVGVKNSNFDNTHAVVGVHGAGSGIGFYVMFNGY